MSLLVSKDDQLSRDYELFPSSNASFFEQYTYVWACLACPSPADADVAASACMRGVPVAG